MYNFIVGNFSCGIFLKKLLQKFPYSLIELKGKYMTDMDKMLDPWGIPYQMDGRCVYSFGVENMDPRVFKMVYKEMATLSKLVPPYLTEFDSGIISLESIKNKFDYSGKIKDPWDHYYRCHKFKIKNEGNDDCCYPYCQKADGGYHHHIYFKSPVKKIMVNYQ